MDLKEKKLRQCSKPVQKAIQYLEEEYRVKKSRILKQINDLKNELKKPSLSKKAKSRLDYRLNELQTEYKQPEFTDRDTKPVMLLSKIDPNYQKRFIMCSTKEGFDYYFPSTEEPDLFSDLLQLGVDVSRHIEIIQSNSLNDGRITYNHSEIPGLLKFLLQCKPFDQLTLRGLEYYVQNYKEILSNQYHDVDAVSSGLEALIIADPIKFSKEIDFHKEHLIKQQKKNGSIYSRDYAIIVDTAISLKALSLVLEPDDPVMKKGHTFLENILNDKKTYKKNWPSNIALVALTLIELGDGPAENIIEIKKQLSQARKELCKIKLTFFETSPNTNVQSIRSQTYEMIDGAEKEIQIISPYIDMYSELVAKAQQSPQIKVTIITRPLGDFEGERKKFARNAWEVLKKLQNVEIRISDLIHARILVVDSKKLMVSSADWTHAQLYDEFNAGLYTEDENVIINSQKFFKNCMDSSSPTKK